MTALRPNYRRARELSAEIDEARLELDAARGDPSMSADDIAELRAELHDLEHALWLTGYVPESEQ